MEQAAVCLLELHVDMEVGGKKTCGGGGVK